MMNLILALVILFLILLLLGMVFMIRKLKIKEKQAEEAIPTLIDEKCMFQRKIFILTQELSTLKSSSNIKPIEIPKGTIEAVRYAMVHNHPDNGGNPEKFILYKDCYDKLTGKNKIKR